MQKKYIKKNLEKNTKKQTNRQVKFRKNYRKIRCQVKLNQKTYIYIKRKITKWTREIVEKYPTKQIWKNQEKQEEKIAKYNTIACKKYNGTYRTSR